MGNILIDYCCFVVVVVFPSPFSTVRKVKMMMMIIITIIIILPWHTVLEQGKATNKRVRWWSVTLNKKLDTYRVVNSLDCEAARKNILINEVSFGKHTYVPTLLGGAAPKPRKPTWELHEFVLSYVPLPSVCHPPRRRRWQLASAVPAALSMAPSNGKCHETLLVPPFYHCTGWDPTSLGPAIPEEMLGPWSHRLRSSRLWSLKQWAEASIARTRSLNEMLSAYIWKHSYLICPFSAPIFIASCLNYTNERFFFLVSSSESQCIKQNIKIYS